MNIIKSLIDVADLHANRLETAFSHINSLQPLTPKKLSTLSDVELGFAELLSSRFAKLQDLIGTKIFPEILILLQEDTNIQNQLDRLYKLEKRGLLPSDKDWSMMRDIRNSITHEYPDNPELTCMQFIKVMEESEKLLKYWKHLKKNILQII